MATIPTAVDVSLNGHTPPAPLLTIPRYWTTPEQHPYEQVLWEKRTARILGDDGTPVFEQADVEVPAFWSQTATNIVASKYFRVIHGVRERSVKQMIARVAGTITRWGVLDGYFDEGDGDHFHKELTYLLLHQLGSFNSPVWFNLGCVEKPQISACFILDVEDDMESILNWYVEEGRIFRGGSGAGVNLSKLRGKNEPLSRGGKASGPMSFAKAADYSAGAIKSGGVTRRAAKMLQLDIDHPDIVDFITSKRHEEQKANALIAAGYDRGIDGEAYATVAFQNTNHSVVVPDEFFTRVHEDDVIQLRARTTGAVVQTMRARELFRLIAENAHACGDPGLFYFDTVNAWHTTPSAGKIRGANPCSEFVRPPNEACNLFSLNLLRFLRDDGSYDISAFRHAVDIAITAQEILVSRASYPTPAIEANSHRYRTLGLGYANLGALLMAKGMPYDSDEGRAYAASITALMTGEAYCQSARLAQVKGPCEGFATDREAMLGVIDKHCNAIPFDSKCPDSSFVIWGEAKVSWEVAALRGSKHGYRNAQVSLLAPTGTISFMMDCQTTGVEPETALVNTKTLVGGGSIKRVNQIVPRALQTLGYNGVVDEMTQYAEQHGNFEHCPHIHTNHLPVFATAFGANAISWQAHVKMVAAVQPFLSGGVSKTINMPRESTVEDIEQAYLLAWRLGCKSIAVYRDGSKQTQVITTAPKVEKHARYLPDEQETENILCELGKKAFDDLTNSRLDPATRDDRLRAFINERTGGLFAAPQRHRLPDERPAITKKFNIAGHEGYFTVGLYEDGQPGELFIVMAKEGSTISGLLDAFATSVSLALQYGVPLPALVHKFSHARYEPSGFTTDKAIPMAKSITDYIFRWMGQKFLGDVEGSTAPLPVVMQGLTQPLSDAPMCAECGALTVQTGTCYACEQCGTSAGCS